MWFCRCSYIRQKSRSPLWKSPTLVTSCLLIWRDQSWRFLQNWSKGKFLISCLILLKFRFWLMHKKCWQTSWKFQIEIKSNEKVFAKKALTNYMFVCLFGFALGIFCMMLRFFDRERRYTRTWWEKDDISIYRYRTGTGNKFNLIMRMTVSCSLYCSFSSNFTCLW